MSKIISIFLLAGFLFACENRRDLNNLHSNESSNNNPSTDILSNDLIEIYKQRHITGFAVAIVNHHKTIYQQGFGFSDVSENKEYTENTIQNIASISKTFIGIAILKAQEMGKLNLDDPVSSYLPFEVKNPYHPEEEITIRHLATHTSTIKDTEYYYGKSYVLKNDDETEEPSEERNIKFNPSESYIYMEDYLRKVLSIDGEWYIREGFLKNKPGEIFQYSNVGATLAAVVLANATGVPFDQFTKKHILNPLDMTSSGWSFENIDMDLHTKLYYETGNIIPFYSLITYPDGGLITSSNDLSKYLCELINGHSGNGTLLNAESYEELFTEQLNSSSFPESGENSTYNEGIFMSLEKGLIGHSGGDPGVSTFMFFNPVSKIGRILLVNSELNTEGEKQYQLILNKLEEYTDKLN